MAHIIYSCLSVTIYVVKSYSLDGITYLETRSQDGASLSPVAASESNKVRSNDGLLVLLEKVLQLKEDIATVSICTLPTSFARNPYTETS